MNSQLFCAAQVKQPGCDSSNRQWAAVCAVCVDKAADVAMQLSVLGCELTALPSVRACRQGD